MWRSLRSLPHRAARLSSPPRPCATSTGPVRRSRAPTPRARSAIKARGCTLTLLPFSRSEPYCIPACYQSARCRWIGRNWACGPLYDALNALVDRGLAPDNRPLRPIRPTRPLDGPPRKSLPARSLGAPYNRSERLLREARGLRRDLSVQSEGWILGAGVVFTTSRRRTVQLYQERRLAFGGCRSAC